MGINSLIIVTALPLPLTVTTSPGSQGQVSLAAGQPGTLTDRGRCPRSKNINIPIQKLIAGLSADNGSDTGVTNLPAIDVYTHRLTEKRFPPSFRPSYSAQLTF